MIDKWNKRINGRRGFGELNKNELIINITQSNSHDSQIPIGIAASGSRD